VFDGEVSRAWRAFVEGLVGSWAGHPEGLADELVAPEDHRAWLDRRRITAAYGAFAAYAAIAALTTEGQDLVWALWALLGYGAAALLLWRGRSLAAALLVSVALALAAR
jgi:hypothetical protein